MDNKKDVNWFLICGVAMLIALCIVSAIIIFLVYDKEDIIDEPEFVDTLSVHISVVDLEDDSGNNIIEAFIKDIDSELSDYGVDTSKFNLLDYSYNVDNKVLYRLDVDGDCLQLFIGYNADGIIEYSLILDSEIEGGNSNG